MSSLRLSSNQRLLPVVLAGMAFMFALFGVATLASAHVVQVTTAIDITDIKSPHDFERAVQDAVEEAANEAIAFEPAVVALTGVRVIGDRVLLGVLFADEAGKQMLEALGQGTDESDAPAPDDDQMVKPTKIEI
jgi:hypothetical protein